MPAHRRILIAFATFALFLSLSGFAANDQLLRYLTEDPTDTIRCKNEDKSESSWLTDQLECIERASGATRGLAFEEKRTAVIFFIAYYNCLTLRGWTCATIEEKNNGN